MTKSITVAPGIRCREHPTRKHGGRRDRYFTLRFSIDGKQIEEALGWASHGWTLHLAQEKLVDLRRAKRIGEGPTSLREARRVRQQKAEATAALIRREKTVAELWDRYAKEVIAVDNKPATVKLKTRLWKTRIAPAIGALKINEVTDQDVGAIVRAPLRLDANGQAIGGKAEAANVHRLLHHVFSKALQWGLRQRALGHPLETVSQPKVARRERLLTESEIDALVRTLAATDGPANAAIRAIMLTGCRISEILALRWQDIRRDEMELHLTDTKTGFSRRPISAAALAVFDSVERMVGVDFVFRAGRKPLTYYAVETAFQTLARAAGVERCTLHTLRHWFTTKTANSVSNARVGMALTGHKSLQTYMGYVHADKEQAQALAETIGRSLGERGKTVPNVIPMKG